MAGNIIHAIATTNAMAAGLLVTEGIKVLAGEGLGCLSSRYYRSLLKTALSLQG
jgi:hypothetical protein